MTNEQLEKAKQVEKKKNILNDFFEPIELFIKLDRLKVDGSEHGLKRINLNLAGYTSEDGKSDWREFHLQMDSLKANFPEIAEMYNDGILDLIEKIHRKKERIIASLNKEFDNI